KPGEHFRTWGTQLQKRWKKLGLDECLKTENLNDCMTLCHDLEQYDPEIKKRQERPKKDLEFREQEELGMAVKRRAIA
ncbi:5654_t:CDS:2, partial [Racocetra persica]